MERVVRLGVAVRLENIIIIVIVPEAVQSAHPAKLAPLDRLDIRHARGRRRSAPLAGMVLLLVPIVPRAERPPVLERPPVPAACADQVGDQVAAVVAAVVAEITIIINITTRVKVAMTGMMMGMRNPGGSLFLPALSAARATTRLALITMRAVHAVLGRRRHRQEAHLRPYANPLAVPLASMAMV